jgi:hypothetical protein
VGAVGAEEAKEEEGRELRRNQAESSSNSAVDRVKGMTALAAKGVLAVEVEVLIYAVSRIPPPPLEPTCGIKEERKESTSNNSMV